MPENSIPTVRLKCPKCNWQWDTKSKRIRVNCPSCYKSVVVADNVVPPGTPSEASGNE